MKPKKKQETMTKKELTIIEALITTIDIVKEMMKGGLGKDLYMFKLSKMLQEKYGLKEDETIVIIEEAIKSI
jgi:hypothetical protein